VKESEQEKVTDILESAGFKIADMTEKNGVTYFCALSKNRWSGES
jgi:poly-D-alanine transfer protein DltD